MTAQASDLLPVEWPQRCSPDATDRLRRIERDKVAAKQAIVEVLEQYGARHGIRAVDSDSHVDAHLDDLLTDFFADKEDDLRASVGQTVTRRARARKRRWA
jgi:hypothetical protein